LPPLALDTAGGLREDLDQRRPGVLSMGSSPTSWAAGRRSTRWTRMTWRAWPRRDDIVS
jgi:hypothetical protein